MIVALIDADSAARLVEESYNIAWNYLSQSGRIDDPDGCHLLLSEEISRLIVDGERNALRLANKAIAGFERRIAA
ncbi:hypothetical protein [Bradyrhizobium prioriisuperbiae]|uniref:hypothetical protein n=1 Tax=Bradyrhizobium prioriisuperbiae TaxID=2854389 RepID=UPI0028EE5D51|nr:hypothetical protein [Bradyrhizobium prioritasuperba]